MREIATLSDIFKEEDFELRAFLVNLYILLVETPYTKFNECAGDNVFIIETEEDLKEIKTTTAKEDDSDWCNITEATCAFDDCRWIADNKYVLAVLFWTNDGGPTYIIPKEIALRCKNLIDSIDLSN